jgi:hypothetical protein
MVTIIIFCENMAKYEGRESQEVKGNVEVGIDPWHLFLCPQYNDGAFATNLFLFLNLYISSI